MKPSTLGVFAAAIAVTFGAAPRLAQAGPSIPLFGTYNESGTALDTPTMRQRKLQQAIALRTEAEQIQSADGGTLSPAHRAYIRQRAETIRSGHVSSATASPSAR